MSGTQRGCCDGFAWGAAWGVGQGMVYLPTQRGDERAGRIYQAYVVGYYDQLVVLPAHSSPRVIDVYIDNARYKRVRW